MEPGVSSAKDTVISPAALPSPLPSEPAGSPSSMRIDVIIEMNFVIIACIILLLVYSYDIIGSLFGAEKIL